MTLNNIKYSLGIPFLTRSGFFFVHSCFHCPRTRVEFFIKSLG